MFDADKARFVQVQDLYESYCPGLDDEDNHFLGMLPSIKRRHQVVTPMATEVLRRATRCIMPLFFEIIFEPHFHVETTSLTVLDRLNTESKRLWNPCNSKAVAYLKISCMLVKYHRQTCLTIISDSNSSDSDKETANNLLNRMRLKEVPCNHGNFWGHSQIYRCSGPRLIFFSNSCC